MLFRSHSGGPAGSCGAGRSPSRRIAGGTLPRLLPDGQRMSPAAQGVACAKGSQDKDAALGRTASEKPVDEELYPYKSGKGRAIGTAAAAACARSKIHSEGRAKAARPSVAFLSPRPLLLRDFTKESRGCSLKPKPSGSNSAARGLSVADAFFGASPVVASALGIRLGATPRGRFHSSPSLSTLLRKPDISTWQRLGHFYLALTASNFGCRCQVITSLRQVKMSY